MEKYKMLSGEEIVVKGARKLEVTLPEVGLKDVSPTGSWLEQKQIQSALEARKHLVESERIEKSGVLSHAEWREDLKLAEVTQQVGGHWQFMGHHKNNKLYLKPEEVLYLIEANCLVLRYNEVTVSLQQAYSLLLSDNISIIQYKVYASLSRLGYKVFKHIPNPGNKENNETSKQTADKLGSEQNNLDNTNGVQTNLTEDAKIKKVSEFSDKDEVKNFKSSMIQSKETKVNETIGSTGDNESETENQTIEQVTTVLDTNAEDAMGNTTNSPPENLPSQCNQQETNAVASSTMEIDSERVISETSSENDTKKNAMVDNNDTETCDDGKPRMLHTITPAVAGTSMEIDTEKATSECPDLMQENENSTIFLTRQIFTNSDPLTKYCRWKLDKLKNRQSKDTPFLDIHKCFKNCPNMLENQTVTVNIPKEEYLPRNVFLNNLEYVINIESISKKNAKEPTMTSTYSLPDEVSGAHVRRVTTSAQPPQTLTQLSVHETRLATTTPAPQLLNQPPPRGFPPFYQSFRPNYLSFRHNNFWKPRPTPYMTYYQYNILYQKYIIANFRQKIQCYPRMHIPTFPRQSSYPIPMSFSSDINFKNEQKNTRKRRNDDSKIAMQMLKDMAQNLKNSTLGHVRTQSHLATIQSLIQTYNTKFRTKLRLSEDYEIVNDEAIVETITLDDDDEESKAKKPRLEEQADLFFENLNILRQSASNLRLLEDRQKSTSRHRRALSAVIKEFNKYFNADVYMTSNYDVLDRRYISLDTSSDSDCVVEERPKVPKKKMLRNPFNVLKKLAEKQSSASPSPTENRQETVETPIVMNEKTRKVLEETFQNGWLPRENDFGRPEVMPGDTMTARIIEAKKEELLYDFLKSQRHIYKNWTDIKISFLQSIEESNILHTEAIIANNVDIKSLIKADDCSDMPTILKKLRIIKSNTNIQSKSILTIDYDVYNRDVKNFRKGNRPTPLFRVICIEQSSPFPSGVDIATLHANINDNVATIFAVVGISSISYVQLNSTELPVCMPSQDLG